MPVTTRKGPSPCAIGRLVPRESVWPRCGRRRSPQGRPGVIATMLPSDLRELLVAFNERGVEYLLVGGYAVGIYAEPRATKDLDIFVRPEPSNSQRVFRALAAYGAPLSGLTPLDFCDDPKAVFRPQRRPASAFSAPPLRRCALQPPRRPRARARSGLRPLPVHRSHCRDHAAPASAGDPPVTAATPRGVSRPCPSQVLWNQRPSRTRPPGGAITSILRLPEPAREGAARESWRAGPVEDGGATGWSRDRRSG